MNTDQREGVEQLIERVERGMTTGADADFLRWLFGLETEKVVPNPVKEPFEQKVAR